MKSSLTFILMLIWTINASAMSKRVYMAPIEKSAWTMTKNNVLLCQIEHEIPKFGKAIFYQKNGRKINFKLISEHRYKKGLPVEFNSVSANWKGKEYFKRLSLVSTTGTAPVVHINDFSAREAYFELQQGFQINLNFVDDEDGFNPVSVVVSTVNFRNVEQQFSQCITELHPTSFDAVEKSVVYFDFNEEFPKVEEEDRALADMLEYLKVDHHVKTITVVGHTDYKGSNCYNDTLSSRRALYVYDFLLQSNVDPKKLFLEFKGETKPLNNQKDDFSRAKNRRVEILLAR